MDEYETLNHTTWDCKYHIVFIPKYRRKVLYTLITSGAENPWARLYGSYR